MNGEGQQGGSSQIQIKKQVAYIMSCFQDTIIGYSSNRRQLQLVLNQLLKAYRSYRIHRTQSKLSSSITHNKDDVYFEFYLLNNIACLYYTKKQSSKALEYLKQAQKQLAKIEEMMQRSEFDYETRKLQLIAIHMRMAKAKLNLCGVYAMLERHPEALLQCTEALGVLEVVVDSVCDYSMGEKNHQDFLELQKCIKEPSSEIKEVQIRNSYWNQVMNGQSDDHIRDIFLGLFKNSNFKEQVQVRSCLGKIITKNTPKTQIKSEQSRKFLKQFNISSVMKITPINLEQFSRPKHKDDFISLRFLHQLMVYTAIANYTISTQIRIGSMYQTQYDVEATLQSLSALTSSQEENNIFRKQNNLFTAERHHFFAIELMYRISASYLKECPFFSKLIKIYEEIYLRKDNIEIIPQKADEENEISMLPMDNKKFDEDEYFGKKFKESICQTPRVLKKMLGTQGSSQKDLLKIKKKQKEKQEVDMKRKKTVKKGSSISKNEYLCMSPRNNAPRLTSEEKKIKEIKVSNKSKEKLPGSTTLRKSKGDYNPKSPRKMFPY